MTRSTWMCEECDDLKEDFVTLLLFRKVFRLSAVPVCSFLRNGQGTPRLQSIALSLPKWIVLRNIFMTSTWVLPLLRSEPERSGDHASWTVLCCLPSVSRTKCLLLYRIGTRKPWMAGWHSWMDFHDSETSTSVLPVRPEISGKSTKFIIGSVCFGTGTLYASERNDNLCRATYDTVRDLHLSHLFYSWLCHN